MAADAPPTEREAPRPEPVQCRWPRPSAALFYLVARIGLAGAAAWPTAAAVGVMVAAEPDGDAILWGPGAEVLVDVAARLEPAASALTTRAGVALLFGLFLMLVPLALLLASMRVGGETAADSSRASLRPLLRAAADAAPLGLLQGITLLLQIASSALVMFVGALAARSLELGREGQLVSQLVGLVVGALLVWAIGLWQDLARIAAVHHGQGFVGAVGMSLSVCGAGVARPLAAAAWRGAIVLALCVGGLWAGARIGGAPGWGGLGAVAVHLTVMVAAVIVRVSWLRWAGTHVMGRAVDG